SRASCSRCACRGWRRGRGRWAASPWPRPRAYGRRTWRRRFASPTQSRTSDARRPPSSILLLVRRQRFLLGPLPYPLQLVLEVRPVRRYRQRLLDRQDRLRLLARLEQHLGQRVVVGGGLRRQGDGPSCPLDAFFQVSLAAGRRPRELVQRQRTLG